MKIKIKVNDDEKIIEVSEAFRLKYLWASSVNEIYDEAEDDEECYEQLEEMNEHFTEDYSSAFANILGENFGILPDNIEDVEEFYPSPKEFVEDIFICYEVTTK